MGDEKYHNCIVKIVNGTNEDFKYVRDWYDSGRVSKYDFWPKVINPGQTVDVHSLKRHGMAGCSGYVTYIMYGMLITIGFSNPAVGTNKLGVGMGGKRVWDEMWNHFYMKFLVKETLFGLGGTLLFDCQCTGGDTNSCTVQVTLQDYIN